MSHTISYHPQQFVNILGFSGDDSPTRFVSSLVQLCSNLSSLFMLVEDVVQFAPALAACIPQVSE